MRRGASMIARHTELLSVLRQANDKYYNLGRSFLTDDQFDSMMKELQLIESKFPELKDSSISNIVGAAAVGEGKQVKHANPMLSLNRGEIDSEKDFDDFLRRCCVPKGKGSRDLTQALKKIRFVIERKFDGVALSILYDRNSGELLKVATRGDGVVGDDVTKQVCAFAKNIPQMIDVEKIKGRGNVVEVRGELVMGIKELMDSKELSERVVPRNYVAGSLRLIDLKKLSELPKPDFFAYSLSSDLESDLTDLQSDRLELLSKLGFQVDDYTTFESDEAGINFAKALIRKRSDEHVSKSFNWECDGVVIKADSLFLFSSLGSTAKFPRGAIALKYSTETRQAIVEDVEFNVSRNGKITPVVSFEPFHLHKVKLSKASLGTYSRLLELKLHVGDTVEIKRSGDVIPFVVGKPFGSDSEEGILQLPKHENGTESVCPCDLKSSIVYFSSNAFCKNAYSPENENNICPSQQIEAIYHFISHTDISGFGKKTLVDLFKKGLVKDISDIFSLDPSVLQELDGWGEKRANSLVQSIENLKSSCDKAQILSAMGIPSVGLSTAARLLEAFDGKLSRIIDASLAELEQVEGVGSKIAEEIFKFFILNKSRILVILEKLKKD